MGHRLSRLKAHRPASSQQPATPGLMSDDVRSALLLLEAVRPPDPATAIYAKCFDNRGPS